MIYYISLICVGGEGGGGGEVGKSLLWHLALCIGRMWVANIRLINFWAVVEWVCTQGNILLLGVFGRR